MIEIRPSTVDEMLALAGTLFEQHWEEIARNKQVMVLKPNVPSYRTLEANGALLILCAEDHGEVVGYSVNIVGTHLHYADLVYCQNDLLFVSPSHRHGRTGLRLIRETEQLALARGAQLMLWHAKEGTALNQIMPKLGYAVQDIIYSRQL